MTDHVATLLASGKRWPLIQAVIALTEERDSLAAQLEEAREQRKELEYLLSRVSDERDAAEERERVLRTQLEEAQKVIEALRAYRDEPLKANEPIDQGWVNLLAALAAYDKQVKR